MTKTDEQLVKDYFDGESSAFTEIVNRYLKLIYNFTYRLVGNEKIAEDITQEVFLKAWKNIKKFDTDKKFKTWIYSIAKNAGIDYLRKRKDVPMSVFDNDDGGNVIEDNLTDTELKPDEIFALSQNKNHLEKIIGELSMMQRQVIVLKYMHEMSLSEIAEIVNIPIDTAKSHHRRAIIKMRKKIDASKLSR